VSLLPLLALNVGLVVGLIVDGLRMHLGRRGPVVSRYCALALAGLCLAAVPAGYSSPGLGFRSNALQLWTSTQAVAQDRAIAWVERNVPSRAFIILDMYMWLDLHDRQNAAGDYRHADYYWRMEEDPAIRNKVYHDNWRTIGYVVATPQLTFDTQMTHMQLVAAALAHSTVVARFDTGGWTVEVHRVWKPDKQKRTGVVFAGGHTLTKGSSAMRTPTSTATLPSPDVLLNPIVEHFGNQSVGTTSAAQRIYLVNLGPTPLTVRNIAITGSDPGDFAEADTCTGATIGTYGGCTIDVRFTPMSSGMRSAGLAITDNAAGSPQDVPLRGRGYAVSR
jgi:hypothetical protein